VLRERIFLNISTRMAAFLTIMSCSMSRKALPGAMPGSSLPIPSRRKSVSWTCISSTRGATSTSGKYSARIHAQSMASRVSCLLFGRPLCSGSAWLVISMPGTVDGTRCAVGVLRGSGSSSFRGSTPAMPTSTKSSAGKGSWRSRPIPMPGRWACDPRRSRAPLHDPVLTGRTRHGSRHAAALTGSTSR
jgi:hypothetical protein